MNWRGFMKLEMAKAKAQIAEEDSIEINLQPSDLYAMSPKYAICGKCGEAYKAKATCVPCALVWATVAQLTLETTRAYNAEWRGMPSNDYYMQS